MSAIGTSVPSCARTRTSWSSIDRLAVGERELNANVDQAVLRAHARRDRAVDGEARRIRGVGRRDAQNLGLLGVDVHVEPRRGGLIARLRR